jgi:alpha-amylase
MNGVLLQGFHWFLEPNFPQSNGRTLWRFLKDQADHYRSIGIDAIWIPPAYQPAGRGSVGYDVYDHYNVGEFPLNGTMGTKYGTATELKEAIRSLHGDGNNRRMDVYADIVLNQKSGGAPNDLYWEAIRVETEDRTKERWAEGWESGKIELKGYTKFAYPERAGKYSGFQWDARHFDSVDTAFEIRQNGAVFTDGGKYIYRFLYNECGYIPHMKNFDRWVSLEKGNYDYLTSCDLDYGRPDVREEMKAWGEWFLREFDIDGVRIDAVKHISANYIREWVGHVRYKKGGELFAVAEYISGETPVLHNFISIVSASNEYPQRVCLFDFPLFFKFREVSQIGELYDLRNLFKGTLMEEQPALSVSFVENHDYEYGRDFRSHVQEWFKPLAYAYILLRAHGYPCIFFPDYYGSLTAGPHKAYHSGREYLDLLLKLRKQFALGAENYNARENVAGWTRLGFVPGAKGAMAIVINTAFGRVESIRMNTGRTYKLFNHLATIKWTESGFLVVRGAYGVYGNKEQGLWTDQSGWGEFPADGGTVSIWLEDGTGLQ